MPVEKPYSVTAYKLLDRKAKPPTVSPGHVVSAHKTAGAARKAAKETAQGCLFNGPSNIAVVNGPDVKDEVWWKGVAETHRGGDITLRVKAYRHVGGFVVEVPNV